MEPYKKKMTDFPLNEKKEILMEHLSGLVELVVKPLVLLCLLVWRDQRKEMRKLKRKTDKLDEKISKLKAKRRKAK